MSKRCQKSQQIRRVQQNAKNLKQQDARVVHGRFDSLISSTIDRQPQLMPDVRMIRSLFSIRHKTTAERLTPAG